MSKHNSDNGNRSINQFIGDIFKFIIYENMLEDQYNEFMDRYDVKLFSKKYTDKPFYSYCDEFWSCKKVDIGFLNKKFEIPRTILFSDIIKSIPSIQYANFFGDCWNTDITIDNICSKYGLSMKIFRSLIPNIEFNHQWSRCPFCHVGNRFLICRCTMNILGFEHYTVCCNCMSIIDANSPFEMDVSSQYSNHTLYKIRLKCIAEALQVINCPICSQQLTCIVQIDKDKIEIYCPTCNSNFTPTYLLKNPGIEKIFFI